jgi:hypothetical protein
VIKHDRERDAFIFSPGNRAARTYGCLGAIVLPLIPVLCFGFVFNELRNDPLALSVGSFLATGLSVFCLWGMFRAIKTIWRGESHYCLELLADKILVTTYGEKSAIELAGVTSAFVSSEDENDYEVVIKHHDRLIARRLDQSYFESRTEALDFCSRIPIAQSGESANL